MNKLEIKTNFDKYIKTFLEENSKINLMSKNDEKLIFEKHIYDSLSIKFLFDKLDMLPKTILDIGTGGGFPSIPIALEYPEIQVTGIDSIQKKINAISNITKELQIKNIEFIRDRVENIKDKKYDMITSRAVAQASLLIEYAYPLLKKDGYLVLYKSKNVDEEIEKAKPLIRKLHMKISDIIEYSLPLEENYNRCLLVLQK
ncbi:TPA: 16S rRNA (guanine(527)-N(7))-methyltransferase RsmG [Candidatus Gastranaerophilales bacterium HUM_9]|nr:MAG TPA: 16S rRNA (guanine(527)-N(7))-methyltransferase RsmG [Candidatus Gastranaerophilales bacterium HUM_9]HBX34705.1 16S rRNA (guanine(527)-N(7))-methyltransferase RsmG [Cyanobacteria bacterium UBA11440]